jgi:hypothetical protein
LTTKATPTSESEPAIEGTLPGEPEAVAVNLDTVACKGTVTFTRKVNLGSFESVDAGMFVQFDYTSGNTEAELIQRGRDAFFVAKSVVFEQLGIDAVLDDSGVLVELIKANFGGATVEPVRDTPPEIDTSNVQGTVGAEPPTTGGKDALKAWALARFASHPSEFFDNRPKKAAGEFKGNAPDLKHKATQKGIWLS